jgi:hypothetical protein
MGLASAEGGAHFRVPDARTSIALSTRTGGAPLVSAQVGDVPTSLLLDTGAYDHLLTASFAARVVAASPTGKTSAILDHANHRVETERFGEVSLALPGWSPLAPIRPMTIDDRGPRRLRVNVGGLFSPQRLLAGAARGAVGPDVVSFDFTTRELVGETSIDGEARLKGHPVFAGIAPRCGDSYVLAATVEGKEAQLLVDTGSFTTDLKGHSAPGRALDARTSPSKEFYGVGGAIATRMLAGAKVNAGKLSTTLDVPIIDDARGRTSCAHDGVLGMDVLIRCVLVIDPSKMRVACDG